MANQDDNNNQEIEKVEDVEVETTKNTSDTDNKKQNNDDGYEKVCFICRRPESVAGKMIELPNHICVCNDCMQKSFVAVKCPYCVCLKPLNLTRIFFPSEALFSSL